MALYIKDESVADLANKAVKLLGVPNKTEAVRVALTAAILAAKANTPLIARIEAARALADEIGPLDPGYDHKRDMDDLWEN